jgi:uncharacterized protein YbaP (TraB family)
MLYPRLPASARRITAVLVCFLVANFAFAAEHHPLWVVKGKHNTVYLLGSMHLLRASEQLPDEVEVAYRDADKLVMEIDMDDLDPLAVQRLSMELGMLPPGETLNKQIGPESAAKLDAYAQRLGFPTAMLQPFKPWFAAIMLTELNFQKMGLDPQSGVEQRFVAKAAASHKEILGLETIEQQLKLIADLPPPLQTEFLLQSIAEGDDAEKEIEGMIVAWRAGDVAALEGYLTRDMKEFPEIYRPLTVDRNRKWLVRLEEMLAAEQNYLVIVGALHLVGKDGVLDLLSAKGYVIEQR